MPLYIQVERYLTDCILAGEFKEGTVMPSPRQLAKSNTIAKNTVLTAYDRMVAKGYLASQPGKCYYIRFPEGQRAGIEANLYKRLEETTPQWRYELHQLRPKPAPLEGFRFGKRPSVRRERKLLSPPDWLDSRQEGSVWELETLLAQHLNKHYGTAIKADNLCLFEGQQHIFSQVAYRLLAGKMAVVICPCDPSILSILEENNVITMSVNLPMDGTPLYLRHVNTLCKMFPVSAIILDRHLYHLTAGLLGRQNLDKLRQIAQRHQVLFLDHVGDHDLWFSDGKYPLNSTCNYPHTLQSFYVSSYLSPFCYFGLIAGPESYITPLKLSRQHTALLPDDGLVESACEALSNGKFLQQQKRLQRDRVALREIVKQSLTQHLSPYASFSMSSCGLACWLHLKPTTDIETFDALLRESGIRLLSADRYYLDSQNSPAYLFGFGHMEINEIDPAVNALQQLFDQIAV